MGATWRRFSEQVRSLNGARNRGHGCEGVQRARPRHSCPCFAPSRQARQKWHIAEDKEFQATPNARNEMMMREAMEFAAHLRRCEKDIRKMQAATEGDNFSDRVRH